MSERVVYCHCAYAKVVRREVKSEVLEELGASGRDFDAVPDLCEMAARKDPALEELAAAAEDGLRVVACYPRAVRWLFHAAGSPLHANAEILNMRTQSPNEIQERLDGPLVPTPATTPEPLAEEAR